MTVLLREAIGDRLRHARTNQRRTLRDISRAARVSLGYLSEVERGQKEASSELLASICEALELFGKEVMGEFENDPEHDNWKQAVMTGAIQLEEIDTEAFKDRYGKLALNVAAQAPTVAATG